MLKLNYFNDPGHGWLEADIGLIKDMKIEHKISNYSCVKGRNVYLEEDCDACLLTDALKAQGIEYEVVDIHEESTAIRSYKPYEC